jgi:hypothetical protein
MNFTGYQPMKSRDLFCTDIPDVGPTVIALDAVQDDLRDMALEVRILRDVGQADDNDDLEQNTETYIAPKKYRSGTLDFEYNFAKKGKFIGLVKARADEGWEYVARFPFFRRPNPRQGHDCGVLFGRDRRGRRWRMVEKIL